MSEVRSPDCLLCGHPAGKHMLVFGIGVCVNPSCQMLAWNPSKTPAQLRDEGPTEDLGLLFLSRDDDGGV